MSRPVQYLTGQCDPDCEGKIEIEEGFGCDAKILVAEGSWGTRFFKHKLQLSAPFL